MYRIPQNPDQGRPEWETYKEVIPIILDLATRNNISLWQMDWVWMSLFPIVHFEGLYDFIKSVMDAKTTYQPVFIRTLLQNESVSKDLLDEQIQKENSDKGRNFVSREVYEVLVDKHKIVKLEGGHYKLNLLNLIQKAIVHLLDYPKVSQL